MVEEMHGLCEDIVTSRFERGEVLKGIKDETERLLTETGALVRDFSAERKKRDDELRAELKEAVVRVRGTVETIEADAKEKMSDFKAAREEMSKELAGDLKEYTTGIRRSVTGLLTGAEALMGDFAQDRVKMGDALRKELGEYRAGISKEVETLLTDFKSERTKTATDIQAMHKEWQQLVKPRVEAKKVSEGAEGKGGAGVGELELGEIKRKALEIVNTCPNGISLTGIGLKLDLEWRKLIRPAKELLEEGKIRKEDVNYYPVK